MSGSRRSTDKPPSRSKGKYTEAKAPESGRRSRSTAAFVATMLRKIEDKLAEEDAKASLPDFIRLLQLQKELKQDNPKEIIVTWVEPCGEGSASET